MLRECFIFNKFLTGPPDLMFKIYAKAHWLSRLILCLLCFYENKVKYRLLSGNALSCLFWVVFPLIVIEEYKALGRMRVASKQYLTRRGSYYYFLRCWLIYHFLSINRNLFAPRHQGFYILNSLNAEDAIL